MSYVQANTANDLGRRGLGRLGRMGWDNAPYTVYQQPRSMTRLNGEFNPAGPDGSTNTHGAITYRIDPRTGQYNFYRTDIKPRGVFMQNTFQHPAPPTMSALGVPLGRGTQMIQRGRTASGPYIPMRPGLTLSGLGCGDCGGRCNTPRRLSGLRGLRGLRGLGVDECSIDSDCGPNAVCGAGMCLSVDPLRTSPSSARDAVAAAAAAAAQIANATGQRPPVVQTVSWWDQSTNVAGMPVKNPILAGGAVAFAFLLAGMGGKRR